MTKAQALQITAYLLVRFPQAALTEEQRDAFAFDIAPLHDYSVAQIASAQLVRAQDRFPSIHEFRAAYRSVAERQHAGDTLAAINAAPYGSAPTWFQVWWWASHVREPLERRYPEEARAGETAWGRGLTDHPGYLPRDDYLALEAEWVSAGAPPVSATAELLQMARVQRKVGA